MSQYTITDKSDYYFPVIPVTFVRKQKVDIMTARHNYRLCDSESHYNIMSVTTCTWKKTTMRNYTTFISYCNTTCPQHPTDFPTYYLSYLSPTI